MKLKNKLCYVINKEFVVHEQIDIELTVINLQKGHYFIGKGPAIDIFLMLENAMTLDTLVDRTMAIYSVQDGVARDEVTSLIDLWTTSDLVSEVDECAKGSPIESDITTEHKDWTKPIFIAFDDMRDLLLLDPIHETQLDQQGWPVSATDSAVS